MNELVLKVLGEYIGSAFSPVVTVEDVEGGHRVTIVSDSPDGIVTNTFDVMDGVQGPQGEKGDTGERGPQGAQGPKGDAYVLTDADKAEIVRLVLDELKPAEGE